MGTATFAVGLLPTFQSIGWAAPVLLVTLRLLQGLALGGEYGGAATYVAEHAPNNRRGYDTSWIQTTATLGFFMALAVIGGARVLMDAKDFSEWGWRLPFLVSLVLLVFSMVYGPIAAFLVELFPTRIRYTSMSLPYHIGNGWFGGMLPLLATAMVAASGDIYYGLWYAIVVAVMSLVIGTLFLKETKDRDIHQE